MVVNIELASSEETMREAIEIAYGTFVLDAIRNLNAFEDSRQSGDTVTNSMARSAHFNVTRTRTARVSRYCQWNSAGHT
jgi:hypothetical protein